MQIDIEKQVKDIVASIKRIDSATLALHNQANFIAELSFESLQVLELTQRISNIFNIDFGIDIEDIDALASWDALIKRIKTKSII